MLQTLKRGNFIILISQISNCLSKTLVFKQSLFLYDDKMLKSMIIKNNFVRLDIFSSKLYCLIQLEYEHIQFKHISPITHTLMYSK